MAYLALYSPTTSGCSFEVGLSAAFTPDNYMHVVVNTVNDPYSGVVGSAYPYAGNTSTIAYGTVSGLSPGTTYTLYAFAKADDANYYPAGSATITTISNRPADWSWYTSKISGGNFSLTASEWNAFTARINQFRTYKGLGTYGFSTAYSGNPVYAYMFNEARNAISSMASVMSTVSSNQDILANYLNSIRDSLNSIS